MKDTTVRVNPGKMKGFTLLEMLIVLGIIAVIITIAAVSYASSQRKSRDTRRKSDLKIVQNAYEQYYSLCGFRYPTVPAGIEFLSSPMFCPDPTTILLPTPPLDPKGGTPYLLPTGGSNTASSYKVCASLETETPAEYCLTNQQ